MKKKSETDINKLSTQRRLNVQEQLIIKKENIMSEALKWRKNGIPDTVIEVLESKGVDINTSIFLQYQQEVPGGSTDEGLVLTSTGEFYEFDIDKSHLYSWKNVSDQFEKADKLKGIGKSYGALAMEVLTELNAESDTKREA